ncbi:MAG: MoaD/ThiS family protein [Pyrinomonadaceae bacterium]
MKILVLFFGAAAAAAGKRRIKVETADQTRAGLIFDQLIAEYPSLAAHRLLFSVNQQYANRDEMVRDGDEIAVFTAVSGG